MSNQEFIQDIPAAVAKYPELSIVDRDGTTILVGRMTIRDSTGKVWDKYDIEIHPTELYPYRFPLLYEVGGRIPRIIDWHIYGDTQSCCMDIRPSEIINCKTGLRLEELIPRFVIPYLANTTHRFKEGYYKNGEYSHGVKGLVEYYTAITKANDTNEMLRLLISFAKGVGTRTVFHPCFCGSGRKLRNCHEELLHKLKSIDQEEVKKGIILMKEYLNAS